MFVAPVMAVQPGPGAQCGKYSTLSSSALSDPQHKPPVNPDDVTDGVFVLLASSVRKAAFFPTDALRAISRDVELTESQVFSNSPMSITANSNIVNSSAIMPNSTIAWPRFLAPPRLRHFTAAHARSTSTRTNRQRWRLRTGPSGRIVQPEAAVPRDVAAIAQDGRVAPASALTSRRRRRPSTG